MTKRSPEQLRSYRWFGVTDLRSFGHRSRTLQMGYAREDFMGKPVIAIINTWSDINPCHAHFRDARRGCEARRLAGGRLSRSSCRRCPCRRTSSSRPPCSTATSSRSRWRNCCARIRSTARCSWAAATRPRPRRDGRDQHEPADDLHAGRPDDARPLSAARSSARARDIWKYWAEKEAGTITEPAMERHGSRHRALARHLHDHGHRLDHDGASPRRSA